MNLPVVYLPEAQDDIDATYARYDGQRPGLGDRFLNALRQRIDHIQASPALDGVFYQQVRAAALRRFPQIVYYRVESAQILVIAVQHGRRSSRAWQDRA
jgi:plasmid stabilization system protein ParE